MTRIKKTRKSGPLASSKAQNPRAPKLVERNSVQHGKGHKPGSRNSVVEKADRAAAKQRAQSGHDPRHGSKKPVQLVSPSTVAAPAVAANPLEAELEALQNDVRLQQLLDRIEAGDELNDADLAYVDTCTERFQVLADKLGLLDDDDFDDEEGE